MTLKTFLKECSEKDVFKRLSIYIVFSWVLIQVLAVTWEPLGLPKVTVTYLIIGLILGLPVFIFYIWKVRLAPLEKLKEVRISKKGKRKRSGFHKMYFSILTVVFFLSLIATVFIVENVFFSSIQLPKKISSDKIAILKFGNNTGDPKNDVYGKMTSDWIMHGITQQQIGQVVSPEILNEYIGFLEVTGEEADDKEVLNSYFKPAKVISGNYFLKEGKLLFQCSITDGDFDKTLISFDPVQCDREDPLGCIESLKQRILGFLITEITPELNLQETPPKFEAYEYFIDAKANYSNPEIYIDLLNKAIAADSTYFEAKVDRVLYHYNMGEFRVADSLFSTIVPNSMNSTRQINLLNEYKALIDGNNKKAHAYALKEYNYAPFHLETNSGVMVLTLQYVNKPEAIDSMFTTIPMDKMNLENCTFCQFRYYIQALAQVELEQYEQAIETLTPVVEKIDAFYLKRPIIAAMIRSNNFTKLEALLRNIELYDSGNTFSNALLLAGKECVLLGNSAQAKKYFGMVIAKGDGTAATRELADAMYYNEQYDEAQPILEMLLSENPNDEALMAKLAVAAFKTGAQLRSSVLLQRLNDARADYQYGSIDYVLAQYYAATGDREKSLQHLLVSIANGNSYTWQTYQNDPHFKDFHNIPAFQNILTFWH